MNILVVAHYQNDGSPTAIFIHDQVRAYAALGHQVQVIVPIPYGKQGYQTDSRFRSALREIDGIPHWFVRYLSLSKYGSRGLNSSCCIAAIKGKLPALLGGFCPDVIHAHTLGFDSAIGVWLKAQFSCPLVVTTHGSDASVPYEQGRLQWLRQQCDRADTVVAVSSVLANKLRASGTAAPVCSILNGFAIRNLPENLAKRPCTMLQAGALLSAKRQTVTLRAFAALKKKYPDMTLTLVGQGPEQENLNALCAELGIAEAVRFTGQLSNQNVLAEMAQARFFCMPSVREGFGIVYLEAMACGCITIGTEGEGIADLIENGKNGFLVPPDDPDAIVDVAEWCFAHPGPADAIAQRGKQVAMTLTWEKNAVKYIALFQSLIQQK